MLKLCPSWYLAQNLTYVDVVKRVLAFPSLCHSFMLGSFELLLSRPL